jgi:hypothetical protein
MPNQRIIMTWLETIQNNRSLRKKMTMLIGTNAIILLSALEINYKTEKIMFCSRYCYFRLPMNSSSALLSFSKFCRHIRRQCFSLKIGIRSLRLPINMRKNKNMPFTNSMLGWICHSWSESTSTSFRNWSASCQDLTNTILPIACSLGLARFPQTFSWPFQLSS